MKPSALNDKPSTLLAAWCLSLLLVSALWSCSSETAPEQYTLVRTAEAPQWEMDWSSNEPRPSWQEPLVPIFENWTISLVQIQPELQIYASKDDLLALFVGDEIRGLATPAVTVGAEGSSDVSFLLKAYGNETDQQQVFATLKYYCSRLHHTFSRTVTTTYSMEESMGLGDDFIPQFILGPSKYPIVMHRVVEATPIGKAGITPAEGDIVGAFVGEECRGVMKVYTLLEPFAIYGREPGEMITLKYYDAANGQIYTFTDAIKIITNDNASL